MYPVSEAFLQAVQENTRRQKWSGRITTVKGTKYEFTDKDIVKGSGYITRQCCGSTEIELGSVYAAEMGITLFLDVDRYSLEDATVELFYSIRLADGFWETIPMGIYEISEANRNIKTLEIKAYDYMLRFEKSTATDSSSGYPYEFLSYACEKCKVELAHTKEEIEAMPNGAELLGIYPDGNIETYRDLIFYVAQVLGRVCQINREGKLQLFSYGNEPVVELEAKHRFSSSYSDFVTRYTAVYSTNEVDAKSEYYCLEPDDGLTMNLGINPLLQYGLQNTREAVITNILNAIAVVRYVPFDSSTIGNPALDPMDVVRFSGGHADKDAISCITSITYKIHGKHSLKGVGKNPLLSSAKSKADKNIIGLLNQVETNKYVICAYENASELLVGSEPIRIIDVTFASIESTSVLFIGNVNCIVTAEEESVSGEYTASHQMPTVDSIIAKAVAEAKEAEEIPEIEYETVEEDVTVPITRKLDPVVTFLYRIDDTWIEDYQPKQKLHDGENILSLLYPICGLGANSAKRLEVYMTVEGGEITIAPANCKAAVAGSGIASGYTEWDGKIVIEEYVGVISMGSNKVTLRKIEENADFNLWNETIYGFADSVSLMKLNGSMKLVGLSDSVGID
ncbi:MAG: hypothetical protein MR945_04385 [Agathobacter sp.]|nr:hypothetical protein [Agathobacter sp.]